VEPLTGRLPPPHPHSLFGLSLIEFVETPPPPPPEKIPGYATAVSGYRGFTGRGSQDRRNNNTIDSSKAFDLVPYDRLLTKIAATGVDLRVVAWVKQFLLGRSQTVRGEGQLSEEVRVTSGVPQGSVCWTSTYPILC
jgi:hypothetical protein